MRAAVVKPEDFVREVQSRSNQLQAAIHAEAALRIDLSVGVKISIPFGSFDAEVVAVLKAVAEDICVVCETPTRIETRRRS